VREASRVASATLDGFGAVHQNLGATYVAAQPGLLEGGTLCLPLPTSEEVVRRGEKGKSSAARWVCVSPGRSERGKGG